MLKYIGDFEKLKEFGFEKNIAKNCYGIYGRRCARKILIFNTREILADSQEGIDVLYDLITSGLVEKVVEE